MMHVRINIINSETLVHWVTRIYAEHKNLGKERNMVWEIIFLFIMVELLNYVKVGIMQDIVMNRKILDLKNEHRINTMHI